MNIYDLISRAQKLRKETQLDSVSPDRVGGLQEDTLKYINEFQLLASSPSLHKTYASVSAMQSDKSPKSDLTGKSLKPGQLVVIVPANQSDATAGDVYRYDGPSGNTSAWTFVSKIGGVPADAELSATSTNPPQNKVVTEKLTELESKVGDLVYSATLENVASSTIFVRDLHIGAGKYYLYADIDGITCRKQVSSSYPVLAQSIAKTWVAFTNDEATEQGLLQQVSGGVQSFSVIVVSESVLAETIKNRLSIDDNAKAINKNAEDIADLPNMLLLTKEIDAFSVYTPGIIKNNGAIQIMSNTRYHLSSPLAVKEGDVVFATLAYQIQSVFSQMWGYADADCTQPIMELLPCASSYVNKAVIIPVGSGIRYVRAWNDTLRSTNEHLKLIKESPVEEVVKDNTGRIIEVDKNGSGGFSNLLDAVLYAEQFNGTKVIVKRGEYDLINEFKSLYGSDFFDSYDGLGSRGIPLKNNIEIVFEEGAIVKCNYTGANTSVMSIFSAFLAREKGFILDGLIIECTNIRYCVHDERGTSSDSYHNIYRNCVMKLDNSANTAWASKQCIGGGLGKNGRIEVIDCIFESVGAGNNAKVVSWHNNTDGDSKSELTIRGNYFKNGTFALTWYGASTEKTIAKVSNNRLRSEPIHSAEGSATIVNTELLMWNNTVE